MDKTNQKILAIRLRKEGKTYCEILKSVPVAKSTLSLWFREVHLSKKQFQKLTKRKYQAQLRGGQSRRKMRIKNTANIFKEAGADILYISDRELWLMGIMLYWAEGSKEKEGGKSASLCFGNSSYQMIKVYLRWLTECLDIKKNEISFRIMIHENHRNRIDNVKLFWSNATGFGIKYFDRVYYKKHNPSTKRTNIRDNYKGLLDVRVLKSTDLNRKVAGWINAIINRTVM